jgi:FtsZ-binding cell division protein ZapB
VTPHTNVRRVIALQDEVADLKRKVEALEKERDSAQARSDALVDAFRTYLEDSTRATLELMKVTRAAIATRVSPELARAEPQVLAQPEPAPLESSPPEESQRAGDEAGTEA